MDYLNNVRRDKDTNARLPPVSNDIPDTHHDHVIDIDPNVASDPSSIKDRILAEQERKQRTMMEYK